jgi:hypothetical protein
MSKAQCLNCKSIIHSRHAHDFVTCICYTRDIGNKGIFIDGGDEYLRTGGCMENAAYWDEEKQEFVKLSKE